jgi:hypothetical protein
MAPCNLLANVFSTASDVTQEDLAMQQQQQQQHQQQQQQSFMEQRTGENLKINPTTSELTTTTTPFLQSRRSYCLRCTFLQRLAL